MSLFAVVVSTSLTVGAATPAPKDLLHALRDEDTVATARRLSGEDVRLYSGVGALHCRVDGRERTVTAFLVGAFDVVVTVAHAFADGGGSVSPEDCTFINTDSDGRIVERIGVAEFRSKWIDEPSTRGVPRQDIAVARLERISGYAQRTLPFRKFDGHPRDVAIIGYSTTDSGPWIKGKAQAHTDAVVLSDAAAPVPKVVWSDLIPQSTTPGAPVIDLASGAVIGVHQGAADAVTGNLLVIDEWLASAITTYTRTERPGG